MSQAIVTFESNQVSMAIRMSKDIDFEMIYF